MRRAVVLEAMAAARPVIATNWGGPGDYLDESCGILIDPDGYNEMVDRIAEAMRLLLERREVGERMGRAGRERVRQHFTWQGKIDLIQEVYADAMEASGDRRQATALASSR